MASLWSEYQRYEKKLNTAINRVLRKEVANVVIKSIEDASQPNVYDAYDPSLYSRRYSLKRDSSYKKEVHNNTLTVTAHIMSNPRQPGNGPYVPIEISEIITNGTPYGPRWSNSRIYNMQPYPRPWMEPGLQDAIDNRSAEMALENGLISLGF